MKRQIAFPFMITATMLALLVMAVACNSADHSIPTVTTTGITDKTNTSATGGGEVTSDMGNAVTERGVCWSLYLNPTIADSKTSDGQGTGVFTSHLQDLTFEKVYHVRAYATNSDGTGYGADISFLASVADSGKTSFTDIRDGHIYHTQMIGNQIWMAENLAFLPAVSGPKEGSDTELFHYVYGSDTTSVTVAMDSANFARYGVLYNFPAALVSCPTGWHLPSKAEWTTLIATTGTPAGGKLKEIGNTKKDIENAHWTTPNTGATDEFGFRAIPGGQRYSSGDFRYIGQSAIFWSSEIRDISSAWVWHLYYDKDSIDRDWFGNSNGFSVRCIKN